MKFPISQWELGWFSGRTRQCTLVVYIARNRIHQRARIRWFKRGRGESFAVNGYSGLVMPRLSVDQRKRAIDLYRLHGSYRQAAIALNVEYPDLHVAHTTIQYQAKKLSNRYCLHDQYSASSSHGGSHSGRPRSARTPENIMAAVGQIAGTGKSVRQVAREMQLSKSCVHRIVRRDLLLKPYVLQVVPHLTENHRARRVAAAAPLLEIFNSGSVDPDLFFSSDEANVYLDGHVQVRHAVVWGVERPPEHYRQRTLVTPKVTVFAAVSAGHLFGPYFPPQGANVNAANYRELVQQLVTDMQAMLGIDRFQNVWLQQDGATPHTALLTRQFLQQLFPNHLVGAHLTLDWPSHSPDLSMCDFFLWGVLKNAIYARAPFANSAALRDCIRETFHQVRTRPDFRSTLQAVHRCFMHRLEKCMEHGGHFTELRVAPLQ